MPGLLRFGVMADLHMDIMHDGTRRVRTFLRAAREADVDFIISLGDFLYPVKPEHSLCPWDKLPVNLRLALQNPHEPRMSVLREFNQFEKPAYHVMGNHEMDFCPKETVLQAYQSPGRYYAWSQNGWRLIVLDSSYYRENGQLKDYNQGAYFATDDLPYLSQEELDWLEKELAAATEPVILFSHQPLFHCPRGLRNVDDFQRIIARANRPRQKVLLCLNGHIHIDDLQVEDDVLYYTVNSISNLWMGPKYAAKHYADSLHRQYPNLEFVAPYRTPLYAIVEVDDQGVRVTGKQGSFVPPTPMDLHWPGKASPSIASWERRWKEPLV